MADTVRFDRRPDGVRGAPTRPGSASASVVTYDAEARYGYLIGLALSLACVYPNDPCSDHGREAGFTTCQPCVTRAEAERLARP